MQVSVPMNSACGPMGVWAGAMTMLLMRRGAAPVLVTVRAWGALAVATAWGAKLSEGFDFTREDAADDLLLNEVIWRSVRGPDSPMPPPVRAAFVFPK